MALAAVVVALADAAVVVLFPSIVDGVAVVVEPLVMLFLLRLLVRVASCSTSDGLRLPVIQMPVQLPVIQMPVFNFL